MITLYTKKHCSKCDDIKDRLKKAEVEFQEKSSEDKEVLQSLLLKLDEAGIKNPLMPVLEFDDNCLVSNDMGLLKELKKREIL